MSTSGSYDAETTLQTIIRDAFSLLNIIDDEEPIPGHMFIYGRRQLNKLMDFLSIHKGLWLLEEVEITLTPGAASYSMGDGGTFDVDTPKPMQIDEARRVSSSVEIPLKIVSRDEYMSLPNKATEAPVTMIYYHPGNDSGTLYVWPTGTSTENTIKVSIQRPIQDFDDIGNNPDLPKEWILPLEYNLAMMIAPKYMGGTVPPDVKELAGQLLASLLRFDEEKVGLEFRP